MRLKHFSKILILLMGIILILSQIGCSDQKIVFQEGEHQGNSLLPMTFATHRLSTAQFDLDIQNSLYEAESGLELYEQILADYGTLSALLAADRHLKIYVVEDTMADEILLDGSTIYCTAQDIQNGSYHDALVQAYTGFDQLWKLAGVTGAAFGEGVDLDALGEYYSDEANLDTLSLFEAFFLGDFVDFNTLKFARDTATAMTEFILTENGPNALYQPIAQDQYRQEWLASIGLTVTYQPSYDLGFLDGAQYSSSDKYALIITTSNRTYSFTGNATDSPISIMQFLAHYHSGMNTVLAYLKENTPNQYAEVAVAWEEPFQFYFDGDLRGSYAEPSTRSFYFSTPAGLQGPFIETFYYLFPKASGETQIWKNFGLASYLFTLADVPDVNYYTFFLVPNDELTGDDAIYHTAVHEYYLARAEYPEKLDAFDFSLLYEALGVVTLSNPTLDITSPRIAAYSIAEWTNQEDKYLAVPGNSLTYPEAFVFTKYLVETYGLEKMITFNTTYSAASFENTFGLSYHDAFAEFREAYNLDN